MFDNLEALEQTKAALENMIEAIDAVIEINIKRENGEQVPDDVIDSIIGKMLRASIECNRVTDL